MNFAAAQKFASWELRRGFSETVVAVCDGDNPFVQPNQRGDLLGGTAGGGLGAGWILSLTPPSPPPARSLGFNSIRAYPTTKTQLFKHTRPSGWFYLNTAPSIDAARKST